MPPTVVFYHLETSGLDPGTDRPTAIAAAFDACRLPVARRRDGKPDNSLHGIAGAAGIEVSRNGSPLHQALHRMPAIAARLARACPRAWRHALDVARPERRDAWLDTHAGGFLRLHLAYGRAHARHVALAGWSADPGAPPGQRSRPLLLDLQVDPDAALEMNRNPIAAMPAGNVYPFPASPPTSSAGDKRHRPPRPTCRRVFAAADPTLRPYALLNLRERQEHRPDRNTPLLREADRRAVDDRLTAELAAPAAPSNRPAPAKRRSLAAAQQALQAERPRWSGSPDVMQILDGYAAELDALRQQALTHPAARR